MINKEIEKIKKKGYDLETLAVMRRHNLKWKWTGLPSTGRYMESVNFFAFVANGYVV